MFHDRYQPSPASGDAMGAGRPGDEAYIYILISSFFVDETGVSLVPLLSIRRYLVVFLSVS
jgi:hypothetical protein